MKKTLLIASLILIVIPKTTLAKERVSLGYIYNSSITHSQIVENTNNSVNVVAPTCFDLNSNGRLTINNLINKDFIEEMHSKNISVTPFLSNHWSKRRAKKALDNPKPLIKDIVEAVLEYNLDGINVDIENLPIEYRDKLTNFVELLRNELPRDKTLSVAVAANPEKLKSTWIATYDYEKLAQNSDYLILMAYDEHCQGGAPGAVASIDFVKKSIESILEEVSKDKVVLGIPLYGRFWKEGEDYGGEAIVIGCVENIIKKFRIVPNFDTKTMTPTLKFEIDEVYKNAYVNGRYLESGVYNVWYENENSIKAKLKLINEYNLLGAGLWALDNESKSFWNYYKEALNETEYESESEIRIRKRMDSYSRIIKLKDVQINITRLWKNDFIKSIQKKHIERFNEASKEKHKIVCALFEDFEKFKIVKVKKLLLKNYSKETIRLREKLCA